MNPYYQDEHISIYHGDIEKVYPLFGGFDLLLTDPPYGIGEAKGRNKSRSVLATSRDYGCKSWDDRPPSPEMFEWMKQVATNAIIWGGNYFGLPGTRGWLVWDKDNGENDFADCELAWTNLETAVRKFRWKWQGMLQENMANKDERVHPTQKPLELMKWSITLAQKTASQKIYRVFDPYAGSGTTGRAAKDLGLQCVMVEREEQYCEAAAKRLCQQVLTF